jgi:hypothetical protein
MQQLWRQYERNNGVVLTSGLNSAAEDHDEAVDADQAADEN